MDAAEDADRVVCLSSFRWVDSAGADSAAEGLAVAVDGAGEVAAASVDLVGEEGSVAEAGGRVGEIQLEWNGYEASEERNCNGSGARRQRSIVGRV